MNYVLLVFIIILALIILPIFISFKLYYNVLLNTLVFSFSIFGIKIINAQGKFKGAQLVIFGKKKDKNFKFDPQDKHLQFFNKFIYLLFLKIKITKLNIFCDVGKTNDAFTPCIIKSSIDIVLRSLLGFAYTKKGVFNTVVGGEVNFEQNKFIFSLNLCVVLNLFLVLWCLVQAQIKIIRGSNYAKCRW